MTSPPEHADQSEERRRLNWWQETAVLLGAAIALALIIKTFLMQAFYIPSESMEPGLAINDRILVQKVSYWGDGEPQRGDVVVFEDPGGWLSPAQTAGPTNPIARAMAVVGLFPSGGHLVKRVVGVGGDTIRCCDRQGRLRLNGTPLEEETYLARHRGCNGPMVGDCDWTAGPVPEGHLFVMGDNRSRSADSSNYLCLERLECVAGREFVPVDNVVGKVAVVAWPFANWRRLTRPETFEDLAETADAES